MDKSLRKYLVVLLVINIGFIAVGNIVTYIHLKEDFGSPSPDHVLLSWVKTAIPLILVVIGVISKNKPLWLASLFTFLWVEVIGRLTSVAYWKFTILGLSIEDEKQIDHFVLNISDFLISLFLTILVAAILHSRRQRAYRDIVLLYALCTVLISFAGYELINSLFS